MQPAYCTHPPVHDDRAVKGARLILVAEVKPDGQLEVKLNSGTLELAAQRIIHCSRDTHSTGGV